MFKNNMITHNNNGDNMDLLCVVFRTVFFYAFIILTYRLMGKREVGQLSMSDLSVNLLIAELVAISIENYNDSIWYTILPILILLFLEIIMGFISLKSYKVRNLIDGTPSLIINKGKINYKEMIRQRYTLDDLLLQLRNKEIKNLCDVEYAVLENNGTLNVFEYNKFKLNTDVPFALILDGVIQYETLSFINKSDKWLIEYLDKNDLRLNEIFYAFYKNKKVYVILNKDLI